MKTKDQLIDQQNQISFTVKEIVEIIDRNQDIIEALIKDCEDLIK